MTVVPYQKSGVPASAGLSVEQCESAAWAVEPGDAPGQPRDFRRKSEKRWNPACEYYNKANETFRLSSNSVTWNANLKRVSDEEAEEVFPSYHNPSTSPSRLTSAISIPAFAAIVPSCIGRSSTAKEQLR